MRKQQDMLTHRIHDRFHGAHDNIYRYRNIDPTSYLVNIYDYCMKEIIIYESLVPVLVVQPVLISLVSITCNWGMTSDLLLAVIFAKISFQERY